MARTQPVAPRGYEDFAALITGSGTTEAPKESSSNRPSGRYYGVPDDYVRDPGPRTFPRRGPQRDSRPRAPQYETASDDDRRILLGLPSEQLADLQDAMMEVGLIGKAGYRKGIVDESTRRGFADLLGFANQQGTDWRQGLMLYASANRVTEDGEFGPGMSGGTPEALPVGEAGAITQVTAAADLGNAVENVGTQRLGRRLKSGEQQEFVDEYQGIERSANDAQVAAQRAAQAGPGMDGQSGEIIAPPSAGAAADQFIDSRYAQEAAGQSAYSYFEALQQMLGGR